MFLSGLMLIKFVRILRLKKLFSVNLISITFLCKNTIDIVNYTQNIFSISKTVPNGVQRRLRRSRFENLLKLTKSAGHLTTLLTSVIDFYDYSRKCFITQ